MRKILLIAVAFSFITATGYSQEDVLRPNGKANSESSTSRSPWAIGLEAGLGYNMYSADLNWIPQLPNPTLAVLESMDGLSPFFGVFIDYDINSTFGIHTKLQYSSISHSNINSGLRDLTDNISMTYTTEVMELEYKESYNYFVIEPNLRINASEEIYFLVGPSIQFGMGDFSTEYTYRKLENGILFDNGSYVESGEESVAFSGNRIALNLGAGYKFNIGNNIFIAPQLTYHLGLSSYKDDYVINDQTQLQSEGGGFQSSLLTISNQKLNNLRFSVTLWFENL